LQFRGRCPRTMRHALHGANRCPSPLDPELQCKFQFGELSPKTHVIANQRARWCGDPLQICGFFPKIDGDCHAIVRNGSQ